MRGLLLAVPNFSEGRDEEAIAEITAAFTSSGAHLLDRHTDAVHNRSVLTLAGTADALTEALAAGARVCVECIDLIAHEGEHPRIGALDVCPVVWTSDDERPAADAVAASVAQWIASMLDVPVMLYGELARSPERVERAHFRRGGLEGLARRMAEGELSPDLGPLEPHPTAGATLVTARPPLVAFNVLVEGIDLDRARELAAGLREAGGGPAGVRAIAIEMPEAIQISTNVHDPAAVPLARVVSEIQRLAAPEGRAVSAELVGLAPLSALEGYPDDVPIEGFEPERDVIERRLAAIA